MPTYSVNRVFPWWLDLLRKVNYDPSQLPLKERRMAPNRAGVQ